LAAIFEFGGAMLLGRVVTNTIAGGIADPRIFARQPEIYAWGMVSGGQHQQLIVCAPTASQSPGTQS
jgi:phosphate/sulfate permease